MQKIFKKSCATKSNQLQPKLSLNPTLLIWLINSSSPKICLKKSHNHVNPLPTDCVTSTPNWRKLPINCSLTLPIFLKLGAPAKPFTGSKSNKQLKRVHRLPEAGVWTVGQQSGDKIRKQLPVPFVLSKGRSVALQWRSTIVYEDWNWRKSHWT